MQKSHENSKSSAKRMLNLTADLGNGSSRELCLIQATCRHLKDLQADFKKLKAIYKDSSISPDIELLTDNFTLFEEVLNDCAAKASNPERKIPVVTEYLGREYVFTFPGITKKSAEYAVLVDNIFSEFQNMRGMINRYSECMGGAISVNIADDADINTILSRLNLKRP